MAWPAGVDKVAGDGSIGLVESRMAWLLIAGIEYHLGVDALGSADAAAVGDCDADERGCGASVSISSRVVFRAGADVGVGTVRVIHGAEFLPLVFVLGTQFDPAFFLIKLWAELSAVRLRRSSLSTQWRAAWRCCCRFSRYFWQLEAWISASLGDGSLGFT